MSGSIVRVIGCVGLAWFCGAPATASAQVKGIGVEGGYHFQRIARGDDSDNFRQGVGLAVTIPATPAIDVVGLFDFSQKTVSDSAAHTEETTKLQNFAGGVRWNLRRMKPLTPYLQGAAGMTRFSGDIVTDDVGLLFDTEIKGMVQVGGGVTVPLSGRLASYGQANYRRIFTEGGGTNGLTLGVGLRLTVN